MTDNSTADTWTLFTTLHSKPLATAIRGGVITVVAITLSMFYCWKWQHSRRQDLDPSSATNPSLQQPYTLHNRSPTTLLSGDIHQQIHGVLPWPIPLMSRVPSEANATTQIPASSNISMPKGEIPSGSPHWSPQSGNKDSRMSLWIVVLSVVVKESVVDVILPQSVWNKTEEREKTMCVLNECDYVIMSIYGKQEFLVCIVCTIYCIY